MRARRNAGGRNGRLVALAVTVAMMAAACGGDDADEPAAADDAGSVATDDDTAAETEDDTSSDDESASDDTGGGDEVDASAAGTATVTIGDEVFVADQEIVCVQIGGALGGSWASEDGLINISIDLPPPDWENSPDDWSPPSVRVDDDRDENAIRQLQASPQIALDFDNVEEADTVVLDYTVDGSSASGTARFVDAFAALAALGLGEDPPEPVDGSFTLTCA